MSDKDLTAPKAVERICQELLDTCKGQPAQIPWPHRPQHKAAATIRALSAALEKEREKVRVAAMEYMALDMQAIEALDRAEAAEAKLKEAVGLLNEPVVTHTDAEWLQSRRTFLTSMEKSPP